MEITFGLIVNAVLALAALVLGIWDAARPIPCWLPEPGEEREALCSKQFLILWSLGLTGVVELAAYLVWALRAGGFGPPPEHLLFLLVGAAFGLVLDMLISRRTSKPVPALDRYYPHFWLSHSHTPSGGFEKFGTHRAPLLCCIRLVFYLKQYRSRDHAAGGGIEN